MHAPSISHSRARIVCVSSTDIRTVQDLLGHSSVETTMIYLPVIQRPALAVPARLT